MRMTIRLQRSRGAWCPSDLRLDRHLAGELLGQERSAVDAHLRICRECRERAAARQSDEALPALRFPRRQRPAMRGMAALAAAAAVLFVLRGDDRILAPATRAKGSDRVGLYVQHDGALRPGRFGEVVHPGDSIQLTTWLGARRWIAVISVDAAGVVSVYQGGAPLAAWQEPGEDVPLPSSVRLDATLGRETIYVFVCRGPIELDPIVQALRAAPSSPPSPGECGLELLRLEKRGRQ
jgi:hypothetical protein